MECMTHSSIIDVATSFPATLKQHNSDQLPANCGHSLAHSFFSFPCDRLGQLAGSTGDATFIHVENSVVGGGGGGGFFFF